MIFLDNGIGFQVEEHSKEVDIGNTKENTSKSAGTVSSFIK